MRVEIAICILFLYQTAFGIRSRAPLCVGSELLQTMIVCDSNTHSWRATVLNLLHHEKKSVHCAMYSLMDMYVIDALVQVYDRGIPVSVIADQSSLQNSKLYRLYDRNCLEFFYAKGYSKMHTKLFIFGDDLVVTGSANASCCAERHNYEHWVVLHNQDAVLKSKKYFEQIKQKIQQGSYERK